MSDQVIFTKEEVEKIRSVLSDSVDSLCLECGGCNNRKSPRCRDRSIIIDALSIIDSPRPRPKVPDAMLDKIMGEAWYNGKYHVEKEIDARAIADSFGFDVETRRLTMRETLSAKNLAQYIDGNCLDVFESETRVMIGKATEAIKSRDAAIIEKCKERLYETAIEDFSLGDIRDILDSVLSEIEGE